MKHGCEQTVMALSQSLTQILQHPFAARGDLGVCGTSKMLATRPMKVTACGPGTRSLISQLVYSIEGCHGTASLMSKISSSSALVPLAAGVTFSSVLDGSILEFGDDAFDFGRRWDGMVVFDVLSDCPIIAPTGRNSLSFGTEFCCIDMKSRFVNQ
jgi:hypothetical protein